MNILEQIQAVEAEMNNILSKAEAEKRQLSEDEQIRFDGLDVKHRGLVAAAGQSKRTIPLRAVHDGEGADEVRAHGIVGGLADTRKLFNGRYTAAQNEMTVEQYFRAAAEGRTMLSGVGESGGFAAPEAWTRDILQTVNAQSVALPRCRIFPMNEANILHVTLWNSEDQSEGYFGGVVPEWKEEGGTFSAKSPKVRSVGLKAKKLGIYVNCSREAVQDAGGIAAEVGPRMAFAIGQTFDAAILAGSGVGRPLGVINSSAAAVVGRAVADQIAWADVVGMLGKLHPAFVANSAWYANPSCLPELLTMQDASSRAIWLPSNGEISGSMPGYLYGRPTFLTDKIPALGTKGDLILADLSMYAVGIRQAVSIEKSESPEWYAELVSLRSILRADGTPLLDRTITPQNGTELSAFVILE